jgi:hypothetical protein
LTTYTHQKDPRRELYAKAVLYYCEQIEGSLNQLLDAAEEDGTPATQTAGTIHKYVLRLCERLKVLEKLSCSLTLNDRFVDRFAVCVRKTWEKMRVHLQKTWLKEYGSVSSPPTSNNGQSIARQTQRKDAQASNLLNRLQSTCKEFLDHQAKIRIAALTVTESEHDGMLDLSDLTKFVADQDDFDYEKHSTDYYVTEAEFAVGLGVSKRYLANHSKRGFPEPLVKGKSNLYSLKAIDKWYRQSHNSHKFDPIRVPKLWCPVTPNGPIGIRIDESHD